MEFVKVRKGTLETSIPEKQLSHYLGFGWEIVKEEIKPKPKTYDKYNKQQLIDIAIGRKLVVKDRDKKQDIIDRLVHQDTNKSIVNNNTSNEGFTDNLIIE